MWLELGTRTPILQRVSWFRCGHRNRGSAVLINWTIPPHNANSKHIMLYLVICDKLILIVSIGFGPKIYLCSAKPNTLTWWPRPPTSFVELVPIWTSFAYLLSQCECAHVWHLLILFAFLQTRVHSTTQCQKSVLRHLLSIKHAHLAHTHTCPFITILEFWSRRSGDSGPYSLETLVDRRLRG
jgi:hypothetical protein